MCYRVLWASFVRAVLVPCDEHSPALNTLAFMSVYIPYSVAPLHFQYGCHWLVSARARACVCVCVCVWTLAGLKKNYIYKKYKKDKIERKQQNRRERLKIHAMWQFKKAKRTNWNTWTATFYVQSHPEINGAQKQGSHKHTQRMLAFVRILQMERRFCTQLADMEIARTCYRLLEYQSRSCAAYKWTEILFVWLLWP